MVKTVKIKLYYADDELLDYNRANQELWELKRQSRAAANRLVQMLWAYSGFESDWKKQTGKFPTAEQKAEILGKPLDTMIYNRIKQDAPNLNTGNLSILYRLVTLRFKSEKSDIAMGKISVPSYKRDLPIDLHKGSIRLTCETDVNKEVVDWVFELSLFSLKRKQELSLPRATLKFKAVMTAGARKYLNPILEKCYDGVYQMCASKLIYESNNWFIALMYSCEDEIKLHDKSRIMNIKITENNGITCIVCGKEPVEITKGGETEEYKAKIAKRTQELGRICGENSGCGDGRKGHGYKTKTKPLNKLSGQVMRFKNTVNNQNSRKVINLAVQNDCGTIEIESSGDYDLTAKIQRKAKDEGISTVLKGGKE